MLSDEADREGRAPAHTDGAGSDSAEEDDEEAKFSHIVAKVRLVQAPAGKPEQEHTAELRRSLVMTEDLGSPRASARVLGHASSFLEARTEAYFSRNPRKDLRFFRKSVA